MDFDQAMEQATASVTAGSLNRAPKCQVQHCGQLPEGESRYYKRFRICRHHANVLALVDAAGRHVRFCKQCGRFQDISSFEGDRKSCRSSLDKHNVRRQRWRAAKAKSHAALPTPSAAGPNPGPDTTTIISCPPTITLRPDTATDLATTYAATVTSCPPTITSPTDFTHVGSFGGMPAHCPAAASPGSSAAALRRSCRSPPSASPTLSQNTWAGASPAPSTRSPAQPRSQPLPASLPSQAAWAAEGPGGSTAEGAAGCPVDLCQAPGLPSLPAFFPSAAATQRYSFPQDPPHMYQQLGGGVVRLLQGAASPSASSPSAAHPAGCLEGALLPPPGHSPSWAARLPWSGAGVAPATRPFTPVPAASATAAGGGGTVVAGPARLPAAPFSINLVRQGARPPPALASALGFGRPTFPDHRQHQQQQQENVPWTAPIPHTPQLPGNLESDFRARLDRVCLHLFQAPPEQLAPQVMVGIIKLMAADPEFVERILHTGVLCTVP